MVFLEHNTPATAAAFQLGKPCWPLTEQRVCEQAVHGGMQLRPPNDPLIDEDELEGLGVMSLRRDVPFRGIFAASGDGLLHGSGPLLAKQLREPAEHGIGPRGLDDAPARLFVAQGEGNGRVNQSGALNRPLHPLQFKRLRYDPSPNGQVVEEVVNSDGGAHARARVLAQRNGHALPAVEHLHVRLL